MSLEVLSESNPVKSFIVNGISFDMVFVKGGSFMMGATELDGPDYLNDRIPSHEVFLNDFAIATIPVTQELWLALENKNPSYFNSNLKCPLEEVNWEDCKYFIMSLNKILRVKFRLPTEAEWEYAARGGQKSLGYKFSGSDDIEKVAWYDCDETHPVGEKAPNELGLYDMSGNVWEWCEDWYDRGYYCKSPTENPCNEVWPKGLLYKCARGGAWCDESEVCSVSMRGKGLQAESACNNLGFRLAMTI